MPYWIKRIILKSGELVTERELRADENKFDGSPPVAGDRLTIHYKGQPIDVEVIHGNWPGREGDYDPAEILPLRVAQVYRNFIGRVVVAKQKFEAGPRSPKPPLFKQRN